VTVKGVIGGALSATNFFTSPFTRIARLKLIVAGVVLLTSVVIPAVKGVAETETVLDPFVNCLGSVITMAVPTLSLYVILLNALLIGAILYSTAIGLVGVGAGD
jgi:hypothetical protein